MSDEPTFERSVWVSYAGTDKNLVYQLTRYIKDRRSECRFTLYTYLVENDGKPLVVTQEQAEEKIQLEGIESDLVAFLSPGQRIEDLIRFIGGNLRRALFISESYLNSTYCLKELMCCLTRQRTCALFIVTINLAGGFSSSLTRKRNYRGFEQTLTVAEVLTQLYHQQWNDSDIEYRLPDNAHQDPLIFFTAQLNDLCGRLHTPINCETDDYASFVEQLYEPLCSYVNSFNTNEKLDSINTARSRKLRGWYRTELGKAMQELTPFNELDEWLKFPQEHVNSLIEFAVDLVEEINISNNPAQHIKALQTISSILLTTIIPREAAAELHYNTLINTPIRMAEPDRNEHDKRLYIHTALAAAFNHELNLQLIENSAHLVSRNQIELPPLGLEEDPAKQYDVCAEISSLISADFSYPIAPATNRLDFRSAINSYRQRAGDASITLTASLSRFDSERAVVHESISRFLEFINEDLAEGEPPLAFCILLLSYSALQDVEVNRYLASRLTTELKRIL